jgi:MraZ protein
MAAQAPRFVGTHPHGLDEKGRMVLPSKIRAQLGETAMVGMSDRCLGLWTIEGFSELADDFLRRAEAGEAPMDAFRAFMANAAEVTPDQQGRVVIPQNLRDYARLGSEVVVTGRLNRAEIWAKERWEALVGPLTAPADDSAEVDATALVGETMANLKL